MDKFPNFRLIAWCVETETLSRMLLKIDVTSTNKGRLNISNSTLTSNLYIILFNGKCEAWKNNFVLNVRMKSASSQILNILLSIKFSK